MQVSIFTNEGCSNCEEMKQLMNNMGVRYKEVNATEALDPSADGYFDRFPNWRTSGVVDALALLQIDNELPVVLLDGKALPFREAAKELSEHFQAKEKDIINLFNKERCEDGVCALAV